MDVLEMGLKYSMFVTEEYVRQADYQRYLEECVLIGINENTKEKIDAINEGFVDSIKNGITKLWNAIVKMWNKFLEGMNTLFRNDQSYLEKYKDIILKKKFPDGSTVTMHNYPEGVKRLVSAKIPAFNNALIESFKDGSKDQEAIEHSIKEREFKIYYNGKYDTTDNVKTYLRGDTTDEKEFNANTLNMADIYNYCYNSKALTDSIKKSLKELETNVNKSLSFIDTKSSSVRAQAQQPAPQSNQQTQQPAQNNPQQSQTQGANEGYYSHVYGMYITEAPSVNVGGNKASGTANADKADSTPSVKVDVANRNTTDKADTDSVNKAAEGSSSEDELKALSTACRAYLKVCGEFLGVKLTIAQEIYKMYMEIIKALVRSVVGDKKAEDKPVKDTATEYDGTKDGGVKMAKID